MIHGPQSYQDCLDKDRERAETPESHTTVQRRLLRFVSKLRLGWYNVGVQVMALVAHSRDSLAPNSSQGHR
jgi:hypothetical protein